jgi:hypothetical protein
VLSVGLIPRAVRFPRNFSTGKRKLSIFGEPYVREGLLRLTAREALRRFRLLLNDPEGFARRFPPPKQEALAARCGRAFAEHLRAELRMKPGTDRQVARELRQAMKIGRWEDTVEVISKRYRLQSAREEEELRHSFAHLAILGDALWSARDHAWSRALPKTAAKELPAIRSDYRWWLEAVLPREARLRVIGRLFICKLCNKAAVRSSSAPAQRYCPRCRRQWTKQQRWYAVGGRQYRPTRRTTSRSRR